MSTSLRILAPAVAAAFLLAGCGLAENAIEGAAEQAVEKGVEGATGADIEAGEDGFSVKTEDGEFTMGAGGSLPEGFPEGDVPLVEGEILQTAKVNDGEADGYHVTMRASGSIDDLHTEAISLLESAGFSVEGEVDMGEMRSSTLEGAGAVDAVTLGVVEDSEEGMAAVSYTVVMAAE